MSWMEHDRTCMPSAVFVCRMSRPQRTSSEIIRSLCYYTVAKTLQVRGFFDIYRLWHPLTVYKWGKFLIPKLASCNSGAENLTSWNLPWQARCWHLTWFTVTTRMKMMSLARPWRWEQCKAALMQGACLPTEMDTLKASKVWKWKHKWTHKWNHTQFITVQRYSKHRASCGHRHKV